MPRLTPGLGSGFGGTSIAGSGLSTRWPAFIGMQLAVADPGLRPACEDDDPGAALDPAAAGFEAFGSRGSSDVDPAGAACAAAT